MIDEKVQGPELWSLEDEDDEATLIASGWYTPAELETRAKMDSLAQRFFPEMPPRFSGIDPWDARKLDRLIARRNFLTPSETLAVQFLLSVWNPNGEWESERFDAMEAAGRWDAPFKKIFLEWFANPFWP